MLSVIQEGMKTKDLVGVYEDEIGKPPWQRRDESSPKLTPISFASYLIPETGVLTRTYFAKGFSARLPRRHTCVK